MRTLRLTLAYDGTNYCGWQRQLNGPSIQQAVEEAFVPLVGERAPVPEVAGAGRTDAGVHARAQVASVNVDFALDAASVGRALNDRLPRDIRVVAIDDAEPGFHARFDATGKSYRYRMAIAPVVPPFDRWFVWHAPGPRDVDAMRQAAAVLLGRHDFASFQARGTTTSDTVRTIERLEIVEAAGELAIDVDGDGFLRHMVRAIVGTLADVGAGTRPLSSVASILAARDRSAAGPTVPACGLILTAVRYAPPPGGAGKAAKICRDRHVPG